ncbi:HNH endonuclease [Nocardia puris]|uniref:HNH endonuclease n=1 Tax=Nocardia puris TaxID=208602 RepID=UPI001895387C|nr:HNH endonuclease signature motif containing protein [Nocardia puris]MBF6213722.1 HNH endonuclease [Nocardia puris]
MTYWPKSRRRYTGPSAAVLDLVRARCGGRCERCATPVTNADVHHRIPRGMGGTRDPRVNQACSLVVICRPCHDWIESRRDAARVDGWLVSRGTDPASVPVRSRLHGLVLLGEDGTVTAVVATVLDTVAEATRLSRGTNTHGRCPDGT